MGKPLPLNDGDVFDLGGRTIEVKSIPGHTAGSMMFLDHEQKLRFTGDDVNPSLWMQGNGATTLVQWQYGAQLVLDYRVGVLLRRNQIINDRRLTIGDTVMDMDSFISGLL